MNVYVIELKFLCSTYSEGKKSKTSESRGLLQGQDRENEGLMLKRPKLPQWFFKEEFLKTEAGWGLEGMWLSFDGLMCEVTGS